jgi:hypothetical protein
MIPAIMSNVRNWPVHDDEAGNSLAFHCTCDQTVLSIQSESRISLTALDEFSDANNDERRWDEHRLRA